MGRVHLGKRINMKSEIEIWARKLGEKLQAHDIMVATAESCTGGGVAYAITEISGSSAWFDRGFVTYTNQAKQQMLGVPSELILAHGAVSAEVVAAMAAGALAHSNAQLSVAISGIAGPLGGTPEKPVGTVWMGWARSGGEEPIRTRCFQFAGDRHQVREQAIVMALRGMCEFIQ